MVLPKINNRIIKWILLFACVFGYRQAGAHPMPGSVVNLFILEKSIRGEAKIPLLELQSAIGNQQSDTIKGLFLNQYFQKHILAVSGGQKWTTVIDSITTVTSKDPIIGNYKEVLVYFELKTAQKNLRKFTFNYDAVVHQVITHKIMVYVQQDWSNGIQTKDKAKQIGVIELDIPKGKIFPLEVNLEKGSWWKGFSAMVQLGMEHIEEGTDHLLFIITLLLPACLLVNNKKWTTYGGLKYSLFRLLKIITAFTIGHSITLLIGLLGFVKIPNQIIEVIIALSILVSAIHAIKPLFYGKEIFIALGFGFIHGMAFSQTLQQLHLDTTNLILSVLGFNIGIEIMQLFVIAITIPWFVIMSKTSYFIKVKNSLAVLIGIISIGWIFQRITNTNNCITITTDKLFRFSPWIILALSILSLSLFIITKYKKNQH